MDSMFIKTRPFAKAFKNTDLSPVAKFFKTHVETRDKEITVLTEKIEILTERIKTIEAKHSDFIVRPTFDEIKIYSGQNDQT